MSPCPDNFEFLDHLQQSLAVDRDTALSRLGDWLLRYEPKRRHELNFLPAQPRDAAAPARRAA